MFRWKFRWGLALCLCVAAVAVSAQEDAGREYLRSGNRLYRDSMYTEAEVDYIGDQLAEIVRKLRG